MVDVSLALLPSWVQEPEEGTSRSMFRRKKIPRTDIDDLGVENRVSDLDNRLGKEH